MTFSNHFSSTGSMNGLTRTFYLMPTPAKSILTPFNPIFAPAPHFFKNKKKQIQNPLPRPGPITINHNRHNFGSQRSLTLSEMETCPATRSILPCFFPCYRPRYQYIPPSIDVVHSINSVSRRERVKMGLVLTVVYVAGLVAAL